jgi:hypothetical protein
MRICRSSIIWILLFSFQLWQAGLIFLAAISGCTLNFKDKLSMCCF